MQSNLFFKVQIEHEKDEPPEKLGERISRQLMKIYGVRNAELQSVTTDE